MTHSTPLQFIKTVAIASLDASRELGPEWLPDGYIRGQEWMATNPVRDDTRHGSFSVNLETGRWNDYADPDAKGGDLVSLLAYLSRSTQIEAARHIDRRLALGIFLGGRTAISAAFQIADRRAVANERVRLEAKKNREKAATAAQAIWRDSAMATENHPYLIKKRIPPGLARINRHRLVIPLYFMSDIINLQFISAEGEKRFLSGGQLVRCYSPIGKLTVNKPLYICEGWATGATIHLETGAPVACAMSAKNLTPVALDFRARLGEAFPLIIAGDDDRESPVNPGRAAATEAALAVGALVTFPEWPKEAPQNLTDFNDLYVWYSNHGEVRL